MNGDGVHTQIRRLVSHLSGEARERRILTLLRDPSRIKRAQRARMNRVMLKRRGELDSYLIKIRRLQRKLEGAPK